MALFGVAAIVPITRILACWDLSILEVVILAAMAEHTEHSGGQAHVCCMNRSTRLQIACIAAEHVSQLSGIGHVC